MLTAYIKAAMQKAKYEILPDDNTFYGEIPGFDGVYSNADTLEACRDELEEVLEEWILFRISRNLPMPVIGGLELKTKGEPGLERTVAYYRKHREQYWPEIENPVRQV